VPTVTLDWLATQFPAPDVIKIDVEQAELAILRGASSVLRAALPTIVCAVAGRNAAAVRAIS
jgi:FkbM family methyltransferase